MTAVILRISAAVSTLISVRVKGTLLMENGIREKLVLAIISGVTALGGSMIAVHSKVESHSVRLSVLEELVTEIRHDVKVLLRR